MKKLRILSPAAVVTALSVMLLPVAPAAQEAAGGAYAEELAKADGFLESRKLKAAARAYELANELAGGSSADALLGLATTRYHSKDYRACADAARRLAEVGEDDLVRTAAHNLLGLSLLELAKQDGTVLGEAEDAFRKVLELSDGKAVAAHYGLALVLRDRGRGAEALAAARRFLSLAPESAVADGARVVVCDLKRRQTPDPAPDPAPDESPRQPPGKDGDEWAGRARVIEGDVVKPKMISAPQPRYPEAARNAGLQGAVIVQAIVDREGCVADARVLKGLDRGLSESAEAAVRSWVFKPATLQAEPLDVYYNLTVNFRLGR